VKGLFDHDVLERERLSFHRSLSQGMVTLKLKNAQNRSHFPTSRVRGGKQAQRNFMAPRLDRLVL